jgi:TRAP-type C4-dicarboxylate transport system permease small subunit
MAVIAGCILLFMMLLVCYDVLMRYLFRNPTGWAMEVCEYLLVYLTFLGSPWLLREKGHVNVDILLFFFPGMGRKFNLFTSLVATLGIFVLFFFCTAATWDYYQRGITMIKMLMIPKWVVFWIIPFGSFFLGLESARQFFSHLSNSGQTPKTERETSAMEQ